MIKVILLLLFYTTIFALEISIQGAKENFKEYSTLHIKDQDKFLCQEIKDDFDKVVQIICAFTKLPNQKIQKIQNNFFEVDTQTKQKTFFVIIKPFHKMKLLPMVFDLQKDDTVFNSKVELSNHWMIVGYQDAIPYSDKKIKSDKTINFPITFANEKLPFVGSLDFNGNPVHVKRSGDVTEYIKIKKSYEEKEYEITLELINEVLREYPNSLFKAELLFYQIKTYAKLQDYETLIEIAKLFLKNYSSDENVPEVLSLLAKSYDKTGLNSDADYFFDRLFSEHGDSVYTHWGYIYMAEGMESGGNASKAKALYEKALKETSDIDVALEAAYKLILNNITNSNYKDAAMHVQKIIKVKPPFFGGDNLDTSIGVMYDFADNGDFISAAAVAKAIFDIMDAEHDEYETTCKNIGIWLSKTEQKKEALAALNLYLEKFEDGKFGQEVKIVKDELFFDVNDENSSSKLTVYNKLIDEYSKDSIGNKALYEKAKLLNSEGMFRDVLGMEKALLELNADEYKDVQEIITAAAIGMMKQALDSKECASVLSISSQYKIELSNEWDNGIYECAMKGADFILAKKMADRNLKSQDINERKKWLYRYIKVDFATGNYSNVIGASKDLISLIEGDKTSEYRDVYRTLFDTYDRLENSTKMIESITNIVKEFGDDIKDIDRYISMMSVGSDKKDNNLVIEFGQKVMNIQKSSASNAQSPFVEFTLYQAYMDKENHNMAFEVIKSLDNIELNKSDRARQKYLLGNVLSRLWKDKAAQKAYEEAIASDPTSAWAQLAKSAKDL